MKTYRPIQTFFDFVRDQFKGAGKHPSPFPCIVMVIGGLLFLALLLILFTYLVQWLWGWVVPDLFPSAVREGRLAGSLSWWTAFKVVVVLFIVGSLFRGKSTTQVKKVYKGRPVESLSAAPDAAPIPPNRVFPALVDPLTDRELEVLELLAKGLTNQQIAVQLDISESTVVYHIGHIFGKLRVDSRVEAAVWAKERGII